MKQERGGHGTGASARALAPTFPSDDAATGEAPSHADTSHVARRRVASAPAHELDLDEIELFDDAPAPFPPLLTIPPRSSRPPPLPVLVPAIPSLAPFDLPLATGRPPKPRSRALPFVASTLAIVALAALGLWARQTRPRDTSPVAAAPVAAAPPAPVTLTPASEPTPATIGAAPVTNEVVPAVPAAPATSGVVLGSLGHRLWIDGALAASWQESVSCGSHVVQVGSAGTPRTVDVPCGGEITVSP
jgi:hypothetical protein